MTEDRTTHLRLVATSGNFLERKASKSFGHPKLVMRKAEQLQLPHLDSLTCVLASVQNFRALTDFSDFLTQIKPSWIFDIRTIPRLDVLGGARSHVFAIFQKSGITYVDLLGQLGVRSEQSPEARPNVWSKKVGDLLGPSPAGVILLLFDNIELLETSAALLPRALQAAMHRRVAVSTYV